MYFFFNIKQRASQLYFLWGGGGKEGLAATLYSAGTAPNLDPAEAPVEFENVRTGTTLKRTDPNFEQRVTWPGRG